MERSVRLGQAVMAQRAVVVPGCHDALSARLIGDVGFEALRAPPTGALSDKSDWVPSFEEFTSFIGMKEYRALEDAYLPDASAYTRAARETSLVITGKCSPH